jgi:hypothetical protein
MNMEPLPPSRPKNLLVEFLAVPFRPRTYGSLLYIWLAFPLGLAYFIGLVVGFAAGVPLTLVWIGLFVLFATLALAWLAEGMERQLAIRLLGAAVPARLAGVADPSKRFARLRAVGGSSALWKGIVFLFLKFPLGLAGWVLSLVALVVPLAFIAAPFALLFGNSARAHIDLGWWEPDSFVEALPFAFAGLFALLVSLHLHNALGWVWARLAERMLGQGSPSSGAASAPQGAEPVAA